MDINTHGNGPQVGALLEHYSARHGEAPRPPTRAIATLLTLIEVDAHDPALRSPSKPIGHAPRRVVASPAPRAILNLDSICSRYKEPTCQAQPAHCAR